MHDLDRTTFEADSYDYEDEYDDEFDNEYDGEYNDEYDDEFGYEMNDNLFTDEEETELALEFLEVSNEEEMDEWLGSILRKAGKYALRKGRKHLKRYGRKYGRKLWNYAKKRGKSYAKRTIRHLGGYIRRGKMKNLLVSPKNLEFEMAKQLVRLNGAGVQNAVKLSNRMPTQAAVTIGFKKAARKYGTPGGLGGRKTAGRGRSGRWLRRGNRIVLLGA